MQTLQAEELRALKFYEGDIADADRNDPFWGDARAYVTLNALLYDDLASEYTRVREGKQLNPAMLRDLPRLLGLYGALFSAMQKGEKSKVRTGYRVERASDFAVCLQRGETVAFTSTALDGFLPAYGDKQGLVLLTCHVPAETPCAVFSEMLDSYLKSSESEMLLPPFLRFRAEARPLTDSDRRITDLSGEPPQAAYDLRFEPEQSLRICDDIAALPDVAEPAARLYAQIQQGTPESALNPADRAAYLRFKRALVRALRGS